MSKIPVRFFSVVPVSFFALKFVTYWRAETLYDLVWLCNIANAMLALSILLLNARLIWVSTLLILAGIIPWLMSTACDPLTFSSFLTHVLSSAVGVYVLYRCEADYKIWWVGLLILFLVQLIARAITPAEANVNVAFSIYPEVQPYFKNFFWYWLFNTVGFGASLFIYEWLLKKLLSKYV